MCLSRVVIPSVNAVCDVTDMGGMPQKALSYRGIVVQAERDDLQ